MLQPRKRAPENRQFTQEEKEYRVKALIKLEKLQKEILTLKGKERRRAIDAYMQGFLWILKNEPIYLMRY